MGQFARVAGPLTLTIILTLFPIFGLANLRTGSAPRLVGYDPQLREAIKLLNDLELDFYLSRETTKVLYSSRFFFFFLLPSDL